MKSSLAVYLVPLLLLVIGAAVGSLAAPADGLRDGYAIAGFLSALVISAMWLVKVNRLLGTSFNMQPVILQREVD